jgi:hypothetical protein
MSREAHSLSRHAVRFRKRAARLRRWQPVVTNPAMRQQLLAIAESYDQLAAKADAHELVKAPLQSTA